MVVDKVAFFEVGGPIGIKYIENWIFCIKLAWHGQFVFIAEPLSYYYFDVSGVSFPKNIKIEEFYKCAMALVKDHR